MTYCEASNIKVGDRYKQAGRIWQVTDTTADIITLKSGNGKRPDKIVHPSELIAYKKIVP